MDLKLKGALVGMLLGDAGISRPIGHKGTNKLNHAPVMQINHAAANRDYVLWKKLIVEELVGCRVMDYRGKSPKGIYFDYVKMYTKSHPKLTDLYERFYYQGRKTVDAHIMKCLTAKGLAIWYMDDGSIHQKDLTVKLSTCGFNAAEHDLMVRFLAARFGLHFTVWKNGAYFILGLKEKSVDRFMSLIWEYVMQVPSMRYKLGPYVEHPMDLGLMTQSEPCGNAWSEAEMPSPSQEVTAS